MRILLTRTIPSLLRASLMLPEPKLADASSPAIETVWGRGYALREPGTQKIAI